MKYLMSSCILTITACSGGVTEPVETPTQSNDQVSECSVRSPSDIQMWINAMPGPNNNPTLITSFNVTAPTPGYEFALKEVLVKESYPPQYVFDLVVIPPNDLVTQVETETEVRLETPNFAYDKVASATVNCGKTTFFHVDSVETVY